VQGAASAVESLGRTFGPVWGNASLEKYSTATPFLSGAAFLALALLVVVGHRVTDD
jgi:predicted MFS family arabinose efflux permease